MPPHQASGEVTSTTTTHSSTMDRRAVLGALAGLGIGSTVFQRALAAQAQQAGKITPDMVQQAEWVAGIALSEEERKSVAGAVERDQQKFAALRKVPLAN